MSELLKLIAILEDGTAWVLDGDALDDYVDAEAYILGYGQHRAALSKVVREYSDALDQKKETTWSTLGDDIVIRKALVLDKEPI